MKFAYIYSDTQNKYLLKMAHMKTNQHEMLVCFLTFYKFLLIILKWSVVHKFLILFPAYY